MASTSDAAANPLERQQRRLVAEAKLKDLYQQAIQKLWTATDVCCQKIATVVDRSSFHTVGESHLGFVLSGVQDALRALEVDVWDAVGSAPGASGVILEGGRLWPVSPSGSHDVLRRSLEETQRRCDDLSCDLVRQAEANGELTRSVGTAQEAQRRLLEQLRVSKSETARLEALRQKDASRLQSCEQRRREMSSSHCREAARRLAAVRSETKLEWDRCCGPAATKLAKLHQRLAVAADSVGALRRMGDLGAHELVSMQEHFGSLEREVLSRLETQLQLQLQPLEARLDGLQELSAQLRGEAEKRRQETLSWAQKHASLCVERDDLRTRADREAGRLTSQLQAASRALAAEKAAIREELAKKRSELQSGEVLCKELEAGLDRARHEVQVLEADGLDSLREQLLRSRLKAKEAQDALAAAQSSNAFLHSQLAELEQTAVESQDAEVEVAQEAHDRRMQLVTAAHEDMMHLQKRRHAALESEVARASEETGAAESPNEEVMLEVRKRKEVCTAATASRGALEQLFAEERRAFGEEKLKLLCQLERLRSEVAAGSEDLEAAEAETADLRRKAGQRAASRRTWRDSLREQLRNISAELSDCRSRVSGAQQLITRTSAEVDQQRSGLLAAKSALEAKLAHHRREAEEELRQLQSQLSSDRGEVQELRTTLITLNGSREDTGPEPSPSPVPQLEDQLQDPADASPAMKAMDFDALLKRAELEHQQRLRALDSHRPVQAAPQRQGLDVSQWRTSVKADAGLQALKQKVPSASAMLEAGSSYVPAMTLFPGSLEASPH